VRVPGTLAVLFVEGKRTTAQNISSPLANPDRANQTLRLPVKLPELLFGVATSDHQAEAYEPNYADFRDQWERQQGQTPRGRATDFWNRYPEDIELARDLGCKIFRFSISWSRVEPRRGEFAADVLAHYRKVTEAILAAEMIPLVTLHHFTWPVHVQERGGMTAEKFPQWYRAYVQKVVDAVGELIPYWITFNEPNLLVYGYVKPWWQPSYLVPPGTASEMALSDQLDRAAALIRNVFIAHKLGRAVIRSKNPTAKVGANPFVLGLPGPLQFVIDFLATRTSSAKAFRRHNRRVAEQMLLSQTPVDLMICRFTSTRERAARVAFSHTYAAGVERLVVRKGSQTDGISALAGKRSPGWRRPHVNKHSGPIATVCGRSNKVLLTDSWPTMSRSPTRLYHPGSSSWTRCWLNQNMPLASRKGIRTF
jgi:Glycosyl hydrolase family 1/Bacterial extracellular solute-binding proteins, family 3